MQILEEVPVETVVMTETRRTVQCDVCGLKTRPYLEHYSSAGSFLPPEWGAVLLPETDPATYRPRLDLCPKCIQNLMANYTPFDDLPQR